MTNIVPIHLSLEKIEKYTKNRSNYNVPSEKDSEELIILLQKIEMVRLINIECNHMIQKILDSNSDNIIKKMNIDTINQRKYPQSYIDSIHQDYDLLLTRMMDENKDITNYIIDII